MSEPVTFSSLPIHDGTVIRVPSTKLLYPHDPVPDPVVCDRCHATVPPVVRQSDGHLLRIVGWEHCACMTEALTLEREREERDRRVQAWRTQQLAWTAVCGDWLQSRRGAAQTFETFAVTPGTQAAWAALKDWVTTWDPEQPTPGILLVGPVGVGKTHLLRAVAHVCADRLIPIVGLDVPGLLQRLRQTYDGRGREDDILDVFTLAPLVLLDDLGAERVTDWTLDRLYLLLNARYEAQKPLIATTNWWPSELAERIGPRLTSRLVEMCTVYELSGPDYRYEQAKRRRSQTEARPS